MTYKTLLSPTELNGMKLNNRIVMAPMTRSRADNDGVPHKSTALYYAQRATAGLIISEAINISTDAIGSPLTPGLFKNQQIEVWKEVTEAVHQKGSKIFAQLWHTGRVAHSAVRNGVLPIAPSAIPISGQQHFTGQGMVDYEIPRELEISEIKQIVQDYRQAAINALKAGFDGVELHAAFGYLPNQFLVDSANQRTDEYGGTIENRSRFVLEIMQVLTDELGGEQVGIKLSPNIYFNSMVDSDPMALYSYLISELNRLQPCYMHLMQALFPLDDFPTWPKDALAEFGPMIETNIITNGGYDSDSAETILANNKANLVSFGTSFIANPDLPERIANGWPLATPDQNTIYGGDDEGYISYPNYKG